MGEERILTSFRHQTQMLELYLRFTSLKPLLGPSCRYIMEVERTLISTVRVGRRKQTNDKHFFFDSKTQANSLRSVLQFGPTFRVFI